MNQTIDFDVIDNVIKEWGAIPGAIIPILQGVQEKYNYLPAEIFPYISKKLNVNEARVYGVATFYENFSLEPKGKFIIKVCDGTACHVRNSLPNLERFHKTYNLLCGLSRCLIFPKLWMYLAELCGRLPATGEANLNSYCVSPYLYPRGSSLRRGGWSRG
jgi:hypothetical protein